MFTEKYSHGLLTGVNNHEKAFHQEDDNKEIQVSLYNALPAGLGISGK
jgi:hypothetical protein